MKERKLTDSLMNFLAVELTLREASGHQAKQDIHSAADHVLRESSQRGWSHHRPSQPSDQVRPLLVGHVPAWRPMIRRAARGIDPRRDSPRVRQYQGILVNEGCDRARLGNSRRASQASQSSHGSGSGTTRRVYTLPASRTKWPCWAWARRWLGIARPATLLHCQSLKESGIYW
ncbi:hypothetical protein ASPBRDRAFT_416583 [Aspergillus brasiliensis CBS 101740]|uniref:Uncharacterized protein n=1 Tax=Aspergillus brasiliensis (strain CBS 101740 / IMI 381727 / IBT 21946) TaxID=767769 RepID=A0A1L9UYE2_ASPBC|nr:hypothetical protein ASPBRDRAFT_416583 [Aspergillus brasiliensis CBS 101740]